MAQALIFFGVALTVLTLIHYYLWRRLVRDTTRPGRARRIGTWVVVGLAVLVLATLHRQPVLPPRAVALSSPGSGTSGWP